jgi:hypothetical protein
MTEQQHTSSLRRVVATTAVGTLALTSGLTLGACKPSTAGTACTGDEVGVARGGTILHCVDGQFVAGESVGDFVRNLLNDLRNRQGGGAPTTSSPQDESEHPPGTEAGHPEREHEHHDTTNTTVAPA